jgi:trimeric autotransporter adhesin
VTDTYSLDAGFPTQINNVETETLVIDKDSTGAIWATWTRGGTVWVNRTTNAALQWGTAFQPGSTGTTLSTDDISSLIAFNGRIGVMWSNQVDDKVYFAVHVDTDPLGTWQPTEVALSGPNLADDHISLKQVGGRVLAAVKTDVSSPSSAALLLVLDRGTSGSWSSHTVATKADAHTRPIMLIDTTSSRIHVFAAGPQPPLTNDGAPDGGTIYVKSSPLGSITFGAGVGTPVIRDADVARSNNATSTKQNVSAATGMVVLASNVATLRYWHHHDPLSTAPTAPSADFSATPTSGTAPLAVQFSDGSSGAPTSWAWDFDNNGVTDSTLQHPSHTYAAAVYSVKLTASNAAGSDVETKTNYVTVTSATPPGGDAQTFTAVADSYVNSSYTNSNYGRQTSVRASNSHRPYVQFAVSGLSGAPAAARLRLYVTDPSPLGGDLYLVGNGWTETGITWANAPALPAAPHATGGPAVLNTWYEFDVTGLIGGNGTYSFALRTTSSNSTLFSSREGANPPQLVLDAGGGAALAASATGFALPRSPVDRASAF